MAPGRKLPFSGKAKKEQLKLKRQKKQLEKRVEKHNIPFLQGDSSNNEENNAKYPNEVLSINLQPNSSSEFGRNVNRYALQFYKESKEELERRKKEAFKSLNICKETDLEIKFEDYFPPELDFPTRPPWNFNMSKEELDAREHRYFTEYVNGLEKKFGKIKLSYYELNLETWRQLWRVLEMSDIILFIVDIRFSALMFPPYMYKYVCENLKKDMILVLNKIDLAPADLVVAWKHYFLKYYPTLKIITFTSFPRYNLRNNISEGLQIRRRRGKLRMAAEGAQKLYETCKEIVKNEVDLSSWEDKISAEMNNTYEDVEILNVIRENVDTSFQEHQRYKSGTLTVGCIGQPNVGKSSLMNAIMGKKVVSISSTPGHTKHFQTIYLTKNVILCDCPGLVFPSLMPRTLQILTGAYPIAQVREPYSAVRYLAERLDIPKLLKIRHPENDDCWSAMDICNGWAIQRGFYTAKAARPDVYRAANNILRMCLEGKICLCMKPPSYFADQDMWKNHEEVKEIEWIQAKGNMGNMGDLEEEECSEDSEDPNDIQDNKRTQKSSEEISDEESNEGDSGDEDSTIRTKLTNKFDLLASACD